MKEEDANRPARAQARRGALVLAGVLVLLAAWFAWSGVAQWQADQRLAGLERARDRMVKDTAAAVAEQAQPLGRPLQREEVAAELQSGDAVAASAARAEGWKPAEHAQCLLY